MAKKIRKKSNQVKDVQKRLQETLSLEEKYE